MTPAVPNAITIVALRSPAAATAPAAARMILPGNGMAVASISVATNATAYVCADSQAISDWASSVTLRACASRVPSAPHGLLLPQLPRPGNRPAHRGLGLLGLLVVEIDNRAQCHRLRLQPRVHLRVHAAEHDDGDRRSHHDATMA